MKQPIFADLNILLPPEARGAELLIAQSDLCPAVVIYARSNSVRLFADLAAWGLEAPTHLAVPTQGEIEVVNHDKGAVEFAGASSEAWLLCWFAGARGWDSLMYGQPCHWRGHHPEKAFPIVDVPWLVVLQRKPKRIALDADGLILEFESDAGHLVAMPLYGLDFQSPETTRAWNAGLPGEVAERCRRWTRYLREIPIDCREYFTLDEKADVVTIRQDFEYLQIKDDWNAPSEPIAPWPPFAVLAHKYGFPIRFEDDLSKDEIATLCGPYRFRPNARSATYTMRGLLRYITEMETHPAAPATPAGQRAVERLRRKIDKNPRLAIKTSGGFTRGLAYAAATYAHALAYLDEEQKAAVLKIIDELIDRLTDPAHYMPLIRYRSARDIAKAPESAVRKGSEYSLQAAVPGKEQPEGCTPNLSDWHHGESPRDVEPVGEGICHGARDAYKVVQGNLFGLWSALAATGDFARARRAWPLVRRWFHLPFQTQWAAPPPARWEGLDISRALFDGTIGYARLAAQLGEIDEYRRAACLFAKVCAGWFAMEMMPRYHREHRPSLANLDAPYLIWHPCRINGYVLIANDHLRPNADSKIDSRGWASAYGRMTPNAARFWRDRLRERADELLNGLLRECRPDWADAGAPFVMRSYVLGESAESLERYRAADKQAEAAASNDPLRVRTYRLFQSTPILKEIAIIEAEARPLAQPAVPEMPPMREPLEGAGRTADRTEPSAMPVRVASVGDAGSLPFLYWPGVRAPKKPFDVLDPRLDVLPFGTIRTGDDASAAFAVAREHHPNWCLSLFTYHRGPIAAQADPMRVSGSRINWALGRTVYCSKRFPFKEFKYAGDRDEWLEDFRREGPEWQALRPPHELTNGLGLRPGVEPWIRHAEPDPEYRHWIAIDLGEPRPIDEVVLAHDPGWIPAGYRIECGPADEKWSARLADSASDAWSDLLAEVADNREAARRHVFPPRATRWLRIFYTHAAPVGLSANRLVVWEIEAIGPA